MQYYRIDRTLAPVAVNFGTLFPALPPMTTVAAPGRLSSGLRTNGFPNTVGQDQILTPLPTNGAQIGYLLSCCAVIVFDVGTGIYYLYHAFGGDLSPDFQAMIRGLVPANLQVLYCATDHVPDPFADPGYVKAASWFSTSVGNGGACIPSGQVMFVAGVRNGQFVFIDGAGNISFS